MQNSYLSSVAAQLGFQLPTFLVLLAAFVVALVFLGRAFLPSLLTILGAGVIVLTAIATAAAQAYLIHSPSHGPGSESFSQMMMALNVLGNCARAVGLSLLVTAIFAGRGKRPVEKGQA